MKKYKRYSAGFKEQALVKVYSRGNDQTIQSVADELNINLTTLKTWMKQSQQDVNKPALPNRNAPRIGAQKNALPLYSKAIVYLART